MYFILASADFRANNIGTLDQWTITRNLGTGLTYSGPSAINKNTALNATITLNSTYTVTSVKVTMGGTDITSNSNYWKGPSNNTYTLSIPAGSVTGNISIAMQTSGGSSGGGDEPETPGDTYTITYKYMSGSTSIKSQTTEQVTAGTTKTFSTSDSRAQISGYTCTSVSPSGQQTINNNITVTYNYTANTGEPSVSGNNIMPIARYFINPYLKEGLITNGSPAHRIGLFYLPTNSNVTFNTDYAATRADFTFLAKYTSGDCDQVEQIILQTPSAKEFTTTFELQQGYYGVCWTYGAVNANPTEDEMIITTPAISSVEVTDIEATAEWAETKYLDATTGAIKNGSANYAVIKFHLDKQYNGGINLYNTKASTRFSNLVKFTDNTYSTVEKVIIGPASKTLLGRCLTDLETGYYATMIENSNGPSLDQCAISGYKYN